MGMEKDRKEEERELHDRLRGDLKDDKLYSSNKKFYSITRSNRGFVKNWLLERCSGKKVLDYCCGDGKTAIWAAGVGAEAFGIDISIVSIENANLKGKSK